ncbi:LysM peptidoglycan-binding domain-containing M23 family metallopeptidase [Bradyrhizobium roseum]|uniref:LysM peptidoglycan-binding domain-containing M23 family metallopeptidase n=1 Tax=Bradyrhizobium roseum TaxID=3056648 RepID=UPI0026132804|nr:LysM peptidoglycan-binding domain-containing M23 family metallopeptidase [Bradyrhizobium roseus]WKA31775.1 LysM peptidoglycan-binding domain-containing M23 family metallopeptidase [Bradyrhizobium roseus]
MSRIVELLCSRRVPQVAVLTLMSVGFAGCSADMQTRFSDSSFSNPFASQPDATGSVRAPVAERREPPPQYAPQYARPQAAAAPQFQSQALPPPPVAVAPAPVAPPAYPVSSNGVSGGGRGISSYAPPSQPPIETTATVPPRSVAAARPVAHNGTMIIVGTSDTLDGLAKRYNVSSAAILQANGYKGPRVLSPGQQLIIPKPTAVAGAAPSPAPAASRPVAAASSSSVHVVNSGDTLMGIARRNNVPVGELARANNLDQSAKLSLGMKLTVPGSKSVAAVAAPLAQPAAVAGAPAQPAAPATKMASAGGPPQAARLASATTNVTEEKPVAEPAAVKPSEATGALPTFRWPVRGKVITTYGAKTNGKSNDGINLAVPEGTPVKAAEDGVVAYSGNELKGYGNLVLVRHSNGYVTAYAHASELLVKRGDPIKRGQIIAKSGQSGEVASPQLHFEIRKGSSPVDPLQFLNGA